MQDADFDPIRYGSRCMNCGKEYYPGSSNAMTKSIFCGMDCEVFTLEVQHEWQGDNLDEPNFV